MRRIDFFAALSLATDLAVGQQQGFALRSAVLGVRLGHATGVQHDEVAAILYQALLRYIGCNADSHLMAALLGDEYAFRRDFSLIDNGRPTEVLALVVKALMRLNAGAPMQATALALVQGLMQAPGASRAILSGHCEVAERIAQRLGLPEAISTGLGQLYERWDGHGLPSGRKGEAIAFPVRVVTLAQDAILLCDAFGLDEAKHLIKKRKGSAYDPALVRAFLSQPSELMAGLASTPDADAVRALDPSHAEMSGAEIDAACLVIADMVDMRMPHGIGHSRAVAQLAESAARLSGLREAEILMIRRAGWVHDIGELVLPVAAWTHPGSFADHERDQLRLHTWHGERILCRAGGAFLPLADLAGRHHERLDGSGYHRGAKGADLSSAARILAAAEAYRSWIETRPHRTALSPATAATRLTAAIREGRLCPEAGGAVLRAAGHTPRNTVAASDLTPREIEVLRLLVEGLTVKGVANALGVAVKTADNHVQNLYGKIGVRTRAGAVLLAVERGLHLLRD